MDICKKWLTFKEANYNNVYYGFFKNVEFDDANCRPLACESLFLKLSCLYISIGHTHYPNPKLGLYDKTHANAIKC